RRQRAILESTLSALALVARTIHRRGEGDIGLAALAAIAKPTPDRCDGHAHAPGRILDRATRSHGLEDLHVALLKLRSHGRGSPSPARSVHVGCRKVFLGRGRGSCSDAGII